MVVQTRRSKRQKYNDENAHSSAVDDSPCNFHTGIGKMTPSMDGKEGVVISQGRRSVLGVTQVTRVPTTTSPQDVIKVPQSMPTDDDDPYDGGNHARSKTRSRVAHPDWQCATLEGREPIVTLSSLPDSCLLEIFRDSVSDGMGSVAENPCMSVYPLVCKRWRDLLAGPSPVWRHIRIGSSMVEVDGMMYWINKRAASIKKISYGANASGTPMWDVMTRWPKDMTAMLESLDVACSEKSAYENLLKHGAKHFRNIRSLSLSGLGQLSNEAMQGLAAMTTLEHLSLRFDKDALHPFEGENGSLPEIIFTMTQLRSLTVECRGIRSIQPALAQMKNLEELKLESMIHLGVLPLMTVQLSKLNTLSLKGSKGLFGGVTSHAGGSIEPGTERMFWMIRSLPRLEKLNLDDCGIREFPLLEDLPINTSLKKLSMNENPEMVFKKGLAAFQGLEHVSMRCCNMPCVSSAVTALKNLRYLDISNNGLVECNGLGKLANLRVLHASHNHFPSIPRDILALPNLKELHMYGCIYLEFSSSLDYLATTWKHLVQMDLRKGGAPHPPQYQASSLHWLRKLNKAFEVAHERSNVIIFDTKKDE